MPNSSEDQAFRDLVADIERRVKAAVEIDGLPIDRAIGAMRLVEHAICVRLYTPDNDAETTDKP